MYILQRVHRKLERVARGALHEALSISPVRRRIEDHYERLRAQHGSSPDGLSVSDRQIVKALRETGIYQTHLSDLELNGTDDMLRAAQDVRRDIEARLADEAATGGDLYLVQANKTELKERPEIYLFGLNEKILKIVENYLRLPVAFGGFNFFYTLADGRERGARVWHLDGEDERIIKVAVYLNDVDLDGGPFEMIRERIFKGKVPYKRPARHGKLESIVGKPISSDEVVTCTGPSGSVIFCDTAQYYHRGRPATGSNRAAIFFNYYPRPPSRPYFCGKPVIDISDFDEGQFNLSHYQRQSVTWRDQLSPIAKYVLPK